MSQAAAGYVSVDLLEMEDGILRIDGTVSRTLLQQGNLEARADGRRIPLRLTKRYAQVTLEKETDTDRTAFAAEIPKEELPCSRKKECLLEFVLLDAAGSETVLPVLFVSYQSRLHSELSQSWWHMGPRLMAVQRKSGGRSYGLSIRRAGAVKMALQELRFLKEILCAPNGSKQMFLIRCLYWLAYPFYSGKNIWITFDKLYKGGDCGEYFYKYMCSRKDGNVEPAYVINGSAPDCRRLREEGYRPLAYRSVKQRLSYLYANMVFGTHSCVNSFCGFNNWEIRFVQDRLRAVNTCIQHGLSVQDLSADSNRVVNNNKRYYCAARCEIENLSKPAYDYHPGTLRLTGIPRYDGLANDDRKQILITPTWRSYLAVHSVMGEARGYNPAFRDTEYFRIYQSLIRNRKLIETAKRYGYRIVYLLHPVISAQKQDFACPEGVEILASSEAGYEMLLRQSSLMVTDYSGVQFDFAYMRKPVVYFHPEELPPHYADGGFSYETQGFGEICTRMETLVDTVCGYLENDCAVKAVYRARQDDFFAYSDRENCRRIYEDALQLAGKARS